MPTKKLDRPENTAGQLPGVGQGADGRRQNGGNSTTNHGLSKTYCYAHNDSDVIFTDRISLYVGGSGEGLEPIGEVPNLAIAQPYYEEGIYFLMFCNIDWTVKGIIDFTSIEEAKIKAERGYTGITAKWTDSPYTDDDIKEYLREEYEVDPNSEWWTSYCSFCNRDIRLVSQMVEGKKAQICDLCIIKFYEMLKEDA